MQDEKDFQRRIQRVSELVRQIEETGDPATQATSRELVQLLMELHGAGLEKMMEIVFQAGDHGAHIIDEFGPDPVGREPADSVRPPSRRFADTSGKRAGTDPTQLAETRKRRRTACDR